jgi:acetyltransferase-like isoleucine patch superfamily enzyme
LRIFLKRSVQSLCLVLMFPAALLCGFGRIRALYTLFAQSIAVTPGFVGSYIRLAFYRMTLRSCSSDCEIGFGSYFSQPEASIGRNVSIGAYCVLGRAQIGDHALISTHVQILSGRQQHTRDAEGRLSDEGATYTDIHIGANSWIGASAVVMADVGEGSSVAPGTIVAAPVPAGETAVGNPARIFKFKREATPPRT